MGKGIGYAKTILFGEHFVVYGLPAIGVGLSKKAVVEVRKSKKMKLESEYSDNKLIQSFEAAKKAMGVDESFTVKIRSEIPIASGLGSSAAVSVAFVRAVADECNLKLSDAQVSSCAYEAEKVHHGTPSGIDNTLAASGGAILFQKTSGAPVIRPLRVSKPLHLVIANTGKRCGTTGEIVAAVRCRKDKNPGIYQSFFDAEKKIVESAVNAISSGKLGELGELMNLNHGLLSGMGVSGIDNELIVQKARETGALGAKITGAGCGGSCVMLAKNEKNADEIAKAVKGIGYTALAAVVR